MSKEGGGRGEDDGDVKRAFKNGDTYYDGIVANVAKILKIQPIRKGRVLIIL